MSKFSHLDEEGRLKMVEVGDKPVTWRQATAACRVLVGPKVFPLLLAGDLPKGDVWATARLAGIMAAKNTAQLIPLCHTLPLTGIDIDFTVDPEQCAVGVQARVRTQARTGVEMEALVAAAMAALTIYDMCKAVDRGITIQDLLLLEKTGGKSGDYRGPVPHPVSEGAVQGR
ncbi:MAG: molybdenum cofactor biosynthesis protein C [Deltaproteobacteria bacterium RBG_13_58_19]|nr:MAG: molybdenum cofactor biosynthesis protein C [Deltaproteobacteria bacterium RBG_13_58_19]